MKKTLIIGIATLIFFGCSRTKKEYYKTGELKAEFSKDDKGLKQGEIIRYYKGGEIEFKTYYLNDTFNGKYEEYYTNGEPKIQTMLIMGVQNGEFLEYFPSGKIKQKSYYTNGKENGLFTYYYENGKIESAINMKNGFTQYYTKYDSLGNVIEKKHSMYLEILNSLNKKDSIKIRERIPGFVSTNMNPMFALIEKYGTIKEGDVPKMKYNTLDSAYYITFPPQKDTGRYVIKTFFRADRKYRNDLDTVITIK
jgi:hypothetical protein